MLGCLNIPERKIWAWNRPFTRKESPWSPEIRVGHHSFTQFSNTYQKLSEEIILKIFWFSDHFVCLFKAFLIFKPFSEMIPPSPIREKIENFTTDWFTILLFGCRVHMRDVNVRTAVRNEKWSYSTFNRSKYINRSKIKYKNFNFWIVLMRFTTNPTRWSTCIQLLYWDESMKFY